MVSKRSSDEAGYMGSDFTIKCSVGFSYPGPLFLGSIALPTELPGATLGTSSIHTSLTWTQCQQSCHGNRCHVWKSSRAPEGSCLQHLLPVPHLLLILVLRVDSVKDKGFDFTYQKNSSDGGQ